MGEQLPLFEGFEPRGVEHKLTGTITPRTDEALAIGETVYFLTRGKVVGVNHERKGQSQVIVRTHKLKILGAEIIDPKAKVADAIVAEAYAYLQAIEDDGPDVDPETGEIKD